MFRILFKPFATAIVMATGLVGCASSPPKQFLQSADTFTPCSSAPHCVSSQAKPDSGRYIAPFTFDTSVAQARQALLAVLSKTENVTIERQENRFIHATFRTTVGFVDDVTCIVHPERRIIDVKSSSRIGYYDLGANRRRVEALRVRFQARLRQT